MNKWYLITVVYTKQLTDGSLKRVSEKYLLNAINYTDAEAKIYTEIGEYINGDFIVKDIKPQNFEDIFEYEDSEIWNEVKIISILEDCDSGKEKKITNKFLISASNIKEAYTRIEECLQGMMISFEISSISVTKIIEVLKCEGYQIGLEEAIREEE